MKKMNKQEKPKWFKGVWYNTGDTVRNPFTGDKCELTGAELSMYDFIKGAEYTINVNAQKSGDFYVEDPTMVKLQKEMIKGLDWFRSQNSRAYMTLLD
tara:strand:- start:1445 stop:1738 length:294 start_codon:yes stop_codon:yes gene_type:complete